jgi:hypothetical protein
VDFLLTGISFMQNIAIVSAMLLFILPILGGIFALSLIILYIFEDNFTVFDEATLKDHIFFGFLSLNHAQLPLSSLGLHLT